MWGSSGRWMQQRRWCREDESASKPTTLPPPPLRQNNVPGLGDPLWPSQFTASADHSYTHTYTAVSPNQHTSNTWKAPALLENPTSDHVLTPYVARGFRGRWEAERKATCTLCILGRPASVTHHTEEPQREQTGAPGASPRLWGGGHRRLRGCKGL